MDLVREGYIRFIFDKIARGFSGMMGIYDIMCVLEKYDKDIKS